VVEKELGDFSNLLLLNSLTLSVKKKEASIIYLSESFLTSPIERGKLE